jgi:hypothetical protein
MEELTVRKIARNPTAFLRMVVPLCLELPLVRFGDRYSVFEILTDSEYLVETEVYDSEEMKEILQLLKAQGLNPFQPNTNVRALVRRIQWRLRGMDIFMREYPFIERLEAAQSVLTMDPNASAVRALQEINHLLRCHKPITFGNSAPRRSLYIP